MVNRINLILKAKNITAKQFAEEIGIQPSGMSHILSERNKPSLDFIMKVVTRYPEIDISWLMFGKGEMYDSNARVQPQAAAVAPAPTSDSASGEPAKIKIDENPAELVGVNNGSVGELVFDNAATSGQLDFGQSSPQAAAPAREMDLFSAPVPQSSPLPVQSSLQPASTKVVEQERAVVVKEPGTEVSGTETAPINENRKNEISSAVTFIQPILGSQKKIVKFVVLYDDHTFSEYYPE
ncbi:MAG: helix-turn-helix domain-containing protein [Bacteroidales bacterium]|nr:helix-turn-helix domain-containing protein [Bacteroidales bacterium]